jgi:hypothetical protein
MLWQLIFAIMIFIILIVLYKVAYAPEEFASNSANDVLVCRSPAAISAAKNFYDKSGPYQGLNVMDPISSVQAAPNACDIKYRELPLPGAPPGPNIRVNLNNRRFIYQKSPEGWKTIAVLGSQSGTNNPY